MNFICWLLGHKVRGSEWDDDELGAQEYHVCIRCDDDSSYLPEEWFLRRFYDNLRY